MCLYQMPGRRPPPITGRFVNTVTRGWVGAPNGRAPFRFYGAVVGFVARCLSRTRNLAASNNKFGHRCTLVWPPPVRLFAQPTYVRPLANTPPVTDANAHTHAHADQLWGPQYETKETSSSETRILRIVGFVEKMKRQRS